MSEQDPEHITELIAYAPWRFARTYAKTWPHEYVLIKTMNQQALLDAFCERIARGEGIETYFFSKKFVCLFIGGFKYWMYTQCHQIDLYGIEDDYVLNRAPLYRDGRDFRVTEGDRGV